jgi:hypothetical protein
MKKIGTINFEPGKSKMDIKEGLFTHDKIFMEVAPGVYDVMERDQVYFKIWRGQALAAVTTIPKNVFKYLALDPYMSFRYNRVEDTIFISLVKQHKVFWRRDRKGDYVSKKMYLYDDLVQLTDIEPEGSYLINIKNFTFKKSDIWKM